MSLDLMIIFLMLGVIVGFMAGVLGIGGGSLTVPYLNWRNYSIKVAIATSAALGFPITIAGSIGYFYFCHMFYDSAFGCKSCT